MTQYKKATRKEIYACKDYSSLCALGMQHGYGKDWAMKVWNARCRKNGKLWLMVTTGKSYGQQ